MRHREVSGCLNPWKHHLWRLPSIPANKVVPSYPGKSKKCVALYPLFQTNEGDKSLEHHLVRAACWGRRSFLMFSDAVDLDVKIGFYVGDTVVDRVFPILEECGIDTDADVFIFKEEHFKGDPTTHLGKKLSIFCDKQFADYEWVVQLDCDMWLGSPNRKPYQFFDYIVNHEQNGVGAVKANLVGGGDGPHANIMDQHWHHCLLHSDDMQEKADEWIRRARELAGDITEAYLDASVFCTTCHGGIYAFPIKSFLQQKPEMCEWISRAGKFLQDDEATFSLWHMKGENLFCISSETGIPFCTEVGNLMEIRGQTDTVYFSHLGTFVQEWFWREDADAL